MGLSPVAAWATGDHPAMTRPAILIVARHTRIPVQRNASGIFTGGRRVAATATVVAKSSTHLVPPVVITGGMEAES